MAHRYIDAYQILGTRNPNQDYSDPVFPLSLSLPGGWIVNLNEDGTWGGEGVKANFNNFRVWAGENNITDAIVLWLLARELNRPQKG